MNDDGKTLDIADPQVLVRFAADPNFEWHHRILLVRLSPGRWVGLSPDHELEPVDLTTTRHVVLGRREDFPGHLAADTYAFDPIPRADLERLRRRANTMAMVLGDQVIADVAARVWVFSDADSDRLGNRVADDQLSNAVTIGARGLVDVGDKVEAIEEIDESAVSGYKDSKRAGHGDLRTIGHHEDSQKRRYIIFADAVALFRETKFTDWGFSGPRAAKEFLNAINEGAAADLTGYHLQWLKHSGVNTHTAAAHEHKNLIEMLRLAICRDQLDVTNIMAFELVVRRLVQIELAVARSPSSPDYQNLDILMESTITDGGSAATKQLDNWLTERLKERANIQKQSRLAREEASHASRGSKDKGEEGKGWKKNKKSTNAAGGQSAGVET